MLIDRDFKVFSNPTDDIFEKNDINIEYMYGLSIENDDAYVVFKPSDAEKTSKLFEENGIVTLTPDELLTIDL